MVCDGGLCARFFVAVTVITVIGLFCLLLARIPRTMFESYLISITLEIMKGEHQKVDSLMIKNEWTFENVMVFKNNE